MKKEKIIATLSKNELKNISGGEVQQYRSIRYLFMKRFKVTNDMSGTVAISGIKDINEAIAINEKLNAKINQQINKENKSINTKK